jgi:hypothetical protein
MDKMGDKYDFENIKEKDEKEEYATNELFRVEMYTFLFLLTFFLFCLFIHLFIYLFI